MRIRTLLQTGKPCFHGFCRRDYPSRQTGAALLAFALLLVVGTSFLLLREFNANRIQLKQQKETREALLEAKKALIGYAASYPDHHPGEAPGYLLCPDTTNNGSAGTSCALSTGTSIGRFPYKTLETPEFRDGQGEKLWYVVSDNFRNNPKMEPLNSETAGDPAGSLTVNGQEDIAAVIFAPGEPQNNQDRNTTNENNYMHYLEAVFTDNNQTIDTTNTDDYILLGKDEIMDAVEKRVLGEVKQVLSAYRNQYGAYPWLTPFADPKAEFRNLRGTHNGSDNSGNLSDSTVDFTDWDIRAGDMVINITDGSTGTVTSVTTNNLGIGSLMLGTDNDFDANDEYTVVKTNWVTNILAGTATSGSSNLTLEDSTRDFREIGVSRGNIIDNLDDGSSGIVESVTASDELTVKALGGGTVNQFSSGDNYVIRGNVGQTTGPDDSVILTDANKDFVEAGVLPGDMVVNLTDGSHGIITTVAINSLTVDELHFGTDNDFDTNDYYYLPRYNTDRASREGLLAFHQEGNLFPTAFVMDFNITADSSDMDFDTTSFPYASGAYWTTVENYISNLVAANSLSFTLDEGICRWIVPEIADCYTSFDDFVNISGRDTASVNSQTQITDSTAQFLTDGVKRGDLAHNFDDESFVVSGTAGAGSDGTTLVDTGADFTVYEPYNFVIQNDSLEADLGETKIQGVISEIINANTLVATSYVGEGTEPIEFRAGDTYSIYEPRKDMVVTGVSSETSVSISGLSSTNPDFDAGEYYRIIPAAGQTTGTVDSTTPLSCTASVSCTITDTGADFVNAGIEVGDTIENSSSTPGAAFGEITAVNATTVTATLYGGTQNFFLPTDNYIIYHDYVHSRRQEIHARFRGFVLSKTLGEQRARDVCLGYLPDCITLNAVAFSGNGGEPLITISDFQLDGTEVGHTTFIPTSSSSGSLKVSDIDYYLAVNNGDIPGWLLDNLWQQMIYVAYSPDYVPGGADDCESSGNCLTLTGSGAPDNDKEAIVIISGDELSAQDRTAAGMDDYFEMENADPGDDEFQHGSITDNFNDQTRVIE